MPIQVSIYYKDGNIEKAIRSFKNKVDKSGILREAKQRSFFQTKRERRRMNAKNKRDER